MRQFDLIVVGAGSGLEVSAAAAQRGWKVAVVDEGPFGGTCLNRGCIPSKELVHVADVVRTITEADRFGVRARLDGIDWPFIVRRTFEKIDAEAAQIEQGNRAADEISVFKGPARFIGDKRLSVEGSEIGAEQIVIAAGTRPSVPDVTGLEEAGFVTSDNVMRLPDLPRRLLILGGGFVAAELGHVFGALGSEVTIVTRGPTMLSREDRDVAQRVTDAYARRFRLVLNAEATHVARRNGELRISVSGEEEPVTCDVLLVATGRTSNADRLAVEATGVKTDEHGFVGTDEYLQTNVAGIWALGDIAGVHLLKHSANLEATHVAHNLLNPDQRAAIDYHAMPSAVFGSPQVGSVGLTEQRAEDEGIRYVAGTYAYDKTAYGASIEDHDGFVKVLADPNSGEILGCHVVGHDASVVVQEAVNAMRFRLPLKAIAQSIYIHPALPEVMQAAFGSAAAQVAQHGHAREHAHD